MAGRRVVVTGRGCVSGLGQGVAATWAALAAGRGAIRQVRREASDDPAHAYEGPAAAIDALDPAPLAERFGPRPFAGLDPATAYALAATHEALTEAGLVGHPVLEADTAVIYGTGAGGVSTVEEGYLRLFHKRAANVHPTTIPRQMPSAAASHLSMAFGIRGPVFGLTSACASSAHALAEGLHRIRSGRSQVVVAGGAEACLTYGSWTGWTALKAMAPDTCRPFSLGRQGMVLGEGAATLVLESEEHARARGAAVFGELAGEGASSDAHHITAPSGDGAVRAIRLAHADAGLPIDTPLLYSAHGTGTLLNDAVEAKALREVYGAALDESLVIATKSAHGHLIGAGGALEFLVGLLALERGLAPHVLNGLGQDPVCDAPVAWVATPIAYEALVSASFAFGGLNAVLIGRATRN